MTLLLLLVLAALPPRVNEARLQKDAALKQAFEAQHLAYPPQALFFRVFKHDKAFEVWTKAKDGYHLFRSYRICAGSGTLGPKREEGDGQVPEGFYEISGFNPTSSYHLAMRVSYPNASDRALSKAKSLGGDIMVHGNCVTIGCIPLTDDVIKEVYWLASQVKGAIPIHIFPTKLDAPGLAYLDGLTEDPALRTFWRNLQAGYSMFEKTHMLPAIRVDKDGTYAYR